MSQNLYAIIQVCYLHGDIELEAENNILKLYDKDKLEADILKVAHHGSKTSTSENFLEAVSPKIALIGVGENNTFGHPSQNVIERLENIHCKIYRTDKNGEISIEITPTGEVNI